MEQSKVSTFPLEEKIRVAQRNWSKVGKLPQKPDVMSFEYLHRVADFRFAVSVYCEAISSVLSAKFSLNESEKHFSIQIYSEF